MLREIVRPNTFSALARKLSGLNSAVKHLALHALDIDLGQVAGLQLQVVDGLDGDAFAAFETAEADAAVVAALAVVDLRHDDPARRLAQRGVAGDDVLDAVLGDVGAEDLVKTRCASNAQTAPPGATIRAMATV